MRRTSSVAGHCVITPCSFHYLSVQAITCISYCISTHGVVRFLTSRTLYRYRLSCRYLACKLTHAASCMLSWHSITTRPVIFTMCGGGANHCLQAVKYKSCAKPVPIHECLRQSESMHYVHVLVQVVSLKWMMSNWNTNINCILGDEASSEPHNALLSPAQPC